MLAAQQPLLLAGQPGEDDGLVERACSVSTRAASMTPAMPEALSLAPGASVVASMTSETRESMSPDMRTYRFGCSVPRRTATTFTTQVSSGTRRVRPASTSDRW